MYLNNKEIIEILEEYEINPKKQYAVLIDGDWGSGKTYFIKNEYIKEDKNKLYISLYGVKNKEEINNKIYYSIIEKFLEKNKYGKSFEKVKKASKEAGKLLKPVTIPIKKIFNIDLSGLENINVSSVISLFKNIKDYTLVFDDLERCDIPINEVLGYINDYVEHKNVKVIIIANENEINKLSYESNYELKLISCLNKDIDFEEEEKENKYNRFNQVENNKISISKLKDRVELLYEENKKYKSIKEKLIGFTIKYEPDLSNVYEQMIKEYKTKNKELYEFLLNSKKEFINIMEVNKCKNIRTVVYILDIFETLYNKTRKIINSDKIIGLIYRNTIFSAIGLKNGISIEKILDGCMCNVSVSLYDNKSYNFKSYFTAFDFVNDYIVTGKLDEEKIIKSVNYYKELKFDDLEKDDPFYKLQNYWILSDEQIEESLNKIKENVAIEVYNYRLFPKIIYYLSRIEKLEFKVKLIEEIINEMKIKLAGKKIDYIDSHEFIEDEKVALIYNKHIKEISETIENTNKVEIGKTIEDAFESENWGIELYEIIKKNKQQYFNKRAFMKDFNIEQIISKIQESDSNNIYYFKYGLDVIYCFSNINEYYSDDIENVDKLIEGIENIDQKNFGVTKKEIIEYLLKILKSISTNLKK